jgi:hypothetical protein
MEVLDLYPKARPELSKHIPLEIGLFNPAWMIASISCNTRAQRIIQELRFLILAYMAMNIKKPKYDFCERVTEAVLFWNRSRKFEQEKSWERDYTRALAQARIKVIIGARSSDKDRKSLVLNEKTRDQAVDLLLSLLQDGGRSLDQNLNIFRYRDKSLAQLITRAKDAILVRQWDIMKNKKERTELLEEIMFWIIAQILSIESAKYTLSDLKMVQKTFSEPQKHFSIGENDSELGYFYFLECLGDLVSEDGKFPFLLGFDINKIDSSFLLDPMTFFDNRLVDHLQIYVSGWND